MPDRKTPDPVGAPDSTPPPVKGAGRLLRFLRRRMVFLPVLSVLLVGADAWIVVAVQGWQDKADALRTEATDLGVSLAVIEANLAGIKAEADLVAAQDSSAEARIGALEGETETERTRMDAYTDASLAFAECAAGRLQIVRGLWEHGRGFVADLEGPTAATCEAAQSSLDGLLAGD